MTAAALLNPGMAAWKSIIWEGELTAGQTVLVLGATGASGQIAAQLAKRHGARVVAAGRNQRVLDQLVARGADAAVRVDRPHDELAAAIAVAGPYDLIVDHLWGAPAEAVFAALIHPDRRADNAPQRTRYVLVGMTAGEVAGLPAMTLRAAPVELIGSGIGGQAALADAVAPMPACSSRLPLARSSSTSTPCRSPGSSTPGGKPEATGASSSCPDGDHDGGWHESQDSGWQGSTTGAGGDDRRHPGGRSSQQTRRSSGPRSAVCKPLAFPPWEPAPGRGCRPLPRQPR